jgi:hypothetical protein
VASLDPFANAAPAADATPAGAPVRLRLSAPTRLEVGDADDLVVSIDTPARLSRLSFKVSMNADVLQARSGAQGDWTADPQARFDLAIAPGDDSVAVEAMAIQPSAGGPAASVARIRVQGMAAGATPVRLTDIVAEDEQGRTMAVVAPDATAGVTVPEATAEAARVRFARPVADLSESD